MRHLVLKVIHQEINDRTPGLLVLLLVLLLLYSLKPAFIRTSPERFPHGEKIFVQIEGDVKFPGVYPFFRQPELMELINRAGGLRSFHGLPGSLTDITFPSGAKVVVSSARDSFSFYRDEMSAFYKLTLGVPISLNRESEEGLTAIPGIGPGLASTIVEERSKRGGFKSLEEIMSLNGISQGLFIKIRPYLTL
jgi:competence protein ComEA